MIFRYISTKPQYFLEFFYDLSISCKMPESTPEHSVYRHVSAQSLPPGRPQPKGMASHRTAYLGEHSSSQRRPSNGEEECHSKKLVCFQYKMIAI